MERKSRQQIGDTIEDSYREQIKAVSRYYVGKDIVIWGTHVKGGIANEVMKSLGISCKCFISSRPKADTCYGLPLYTPEILDSEKHYVFLTTANLEVIEDLKNRGFSGNDGKNYLYLQFGQWHDDLIYDGCLVGRGTYGYNTLRSERDLGKYVKQIGRYCSINSSAKIVENHVSEWGKLRALEGKINFINLQMEHIYGPGDGKGKFIPFVLQNMKEDVPELELTDGRQVRDFIHVNDVVNAYLIILDNLGTLSGYCNFEVGTGIPCTLRHFVEKMHSALSSKTVLNFGAIPMSDNEIKYSVADSKPLQALGWKAVNGEDTTWMLQ